MRPDVALVLAALCAVACGRTAAEGRASEPEGGVVAPARVAPVVVSSAASPATSATAAAPAPGEACRKLPIDVGGTSDVQSFEGRVVLASGHDPEQGDGTYGVLVLDAPVCGAYALEPQRELLLGVLGGKAKWEELGAKWNRQRVKVSGSVRSLDVYVKPMRHLLLFVSGIEAGG